MDEGPSPIRIPSPEALGLGSVKVTADDPIDWAMVERRMDQIGATGHQLQKVADGYRFALELRGKTIVGRGASKGEAVRGAFAQLTN